MIPRWLRVTLLLGVGACAPDAPEVMPPPATDRVPAIDLARPPVAVLDLGPDGPPANAPGDPARRDEQYAEARVLVASGQYRKAIQRLERAIAVGPEDGRTRLLLGICRSHDRDDVEGARAELRRAHQLPGPQAEAAFLLGELDQKLGDPDRAVAWLDEALRIDPSHAAAQVRKATGLRRAGRIDEAMTWIDRHVAEHPESAAGWQEHGALCLRLDRLDAAIDEFARATRLDPTDSSAWFNLAAAQRRAGQESAAAEAQTTFELMKSVFSDSRHDLETDAVRREANLREIIGRFPQVWRARLELARQLAGTQGPTAAIQTLRPALDAAPQAGELHAALADLLEQAGDESGAEKERAAARQLLSGASR